jgi:hypothetical protein
LITTDEVNALVFKVFEKPKRRIVNLREILVRWRIKWDPFEICQMDSFYSSVF